MDCSLPHGSHHGCDRLFAASPHNEHVGSPNRTSSSRIDCRARLRNNAVRPTSSHQKTHHATSNDTSNAGKRLSTFVDPAALSHRNVKYPAPSEAAANASPAAHGRKQAATMALARDNADGNRRSSGVSRSRARCRIEKGSNTNAAA